MSKTKIAPMHSASADELESAFYSALVKADIEAIMACWANDPYILCIHPGGTRLVGSNAIRLGFESIFSDGGIRVQVEKVRRMQTADVHIHSVVERVELMTPEGLGYAYVIATNVYQLGDSGWRMLAHHASPGTPQELLELADGPMVLH